MSWKRNLIEGVVWIAGRLHHPAVAPPENPDSIFVLRNNDIGDLLAITPLFEALRRRFPQARLAAGIGSWNRPVLENNPYLSGVLTVNAPWHNKYVASQSPLDALRYIYLSPESRRLAREHFQVGIDILGSPWGSLLLMRAGIPYRLGVRGYAGGHTGVHQAVSYNPSEHVGRSALRFAEMLGARDMPPCRPQIFLTDSEKRAGHARWQDGSKATGERSKRLVVGVGGGFPEKCWPFDYFVQVARRIQERGAVDIILVGSQEDQAAAHRLARDSPRVKNLAGILTLRETFAVVAASDVVFCNPSMLFHAAAAFSIPSVVVQGAYFHSAEQSAAQWGYPSCRIVGPDAGHPEIYSPEEALDCLRRVLAA